MLVIRGKEVPFSPASHEPKELPGVVKRVLIGRKILPRGEIMMVNWSQMPPGRQFRAHYHEDLHEVFVIINGKARIISGGKTALLGKGDAVIIPGREIHRMKNTGSVPLVYIAFGITASGRGKTVIVGPGKPI